MSTLQNGSLIKAFALLDLISDQRPEITATIVGQALQMSPATAYRYLTTLEALGVLSAHHRGVFRLGHRIVQLGQIAERTNPLKKIVVPIVEQLSLRLGDSVMAGRPTQSNIVCIATASAPRPISVHVQIGRQLDLATSAQGKVVLALLPAPDLQRWLDGDAPAALDREAFCRELEAVRAQGYARNRGETEPDIGAVAVPVLNAEGQVELTLSVFGMISRFSDDRVPEQVAALQSSARQIAEALPGRS